MGSAEQARCPPEVRVSSTSPRGRPRRTKHSACARVLTHPTSSRSRKKHSICCSCLPAVMGAALVAAAAWTVVVAAATVVLRSSLLQQTPKQSLRSGRWGQIQAQNPAAVLAQLLHPIRRPVAWPPRARPPGGRFSSAVSQSPAHRRSGPCDKLRCHCWLSARCCIMREKYQHSIHHHIATV